MAPLDVIPRLPPLHNQPMEPHTGTAHRDKDRLTVCTSGQGGTTVRSLLAGRSGLPGARIIPAGAGLPAGG
ncbi:hypothetical protein AB5J72_43555 [Streptomyces sp. CG1]|uniref:hypothetical protein n=1 Tax=Streptomyces sp. CG1 TaxID=1287523 RepID=UPI0034E2396C